MKLWKKPRLAAALCAVVVLVCAAAPAGAPPTRGAKEETAPKLQPVSAGIISISASPIAYKVS